MSDPIRFRHVTTIHKPATDTTEAREVPSRLKYTVAYSFTKTGNKLDVVYGVAQCRNGSKGDTFSRKVGRDLSAARLNKARKLADSNDGRSLHYGKLTIEDGEGVNVGREVAKRFEAERSVLLNDLTELRNPEAVLLRALGLAK